MGTISCPVCKSSRIKLFLSKKNVPVHQNLLMESEIQARSINRGDLDLHVCEECSFVFNNSFDDSLMDYSSCYNNCQTLSPYFRKHVDKLIINIISRKKPEHKSVVEVGCGKGDFLKLLIKANSDLYGYGFDPSYEGVERVNSRLNFVKDFYGPQYTNISADIIVCRHVLEHIQSPVELLLSIRETVKDSLNPTIYFETPCVDWILKNKVIWDFFYEHCSYFTKTSLTTAFKMAGFEVINVDHVFGGQYLWLEASIGNEKSNVPNLCTSTIELAKTYAIAEENIKSKLQSEIIHYSNKCCVALWGAGAKGVTFVNLLDPYHELIDCIVDINPQKQGKFVSGTSHPIVSYKELEERKVGAVIILNSNYTSEITKILKENNIKIQIIEMS